MTAQIKAGQVYKIKNSFHPGYEGKRCTILRLRENPTDKHTFETRVEGVGGVITLSKEGYCSGVGGALFELGELIEDV